MNKAELVDAIAANANLSKADAKRALDGFIAASTDALTKNEKISLVCYRDWETDRKSTRLNSSHSRASRMPSSA